MHTSVELVLRNTACYFKMRNGLSLKWLFKDRLTVKRQIVLRWNIRDKGPITTVNKPPLLGLYRLSNQ